MSHYNLYRTFSIDRALSCEEITVILQGRLTSGAEPDSARRDETTLALAVLGDPARRSRYNRSLGDPDAPEITRDALRELASMQFPRPSPEPVSTTGHGTRLSAAGRTRWLVPALSTVSVLAVIAVVVTWMATRPDETRISAYDDEPEFSAQVTSTVSSELPMVETEDPTPEPTHGEDGDATDDVRSTPVGELTPTGWYGLPEASCTTEDDIPVFVGGNTEGDLITICENFADGDYYYRGYVNRLGGLSWDIDMSSYSEYHFQTEPQGGRYIVVDSGGVKVYSTDANGPVSETDFDWFDSNLNDGVF